MIPRIIHQTWRDEAIPARFQRYVDSWRRHHPGWTYELWTDARSREFVEAHHPSFLARYDSYPYAIQRVDAVRYLLLHTRGGLYVDLDFECFQSLDRLTVEHDCFFGLEPPLHCAMNQQERIIGNALMAAAPGHPFFCAIIDDLRSYEPGGFTRNDLVLHTTGPFMLDRVYRRAGATAEVTLLPSELLYPLTVFEAERVLADGWNEDARRKVEGAYAAHYHAGTWWK